MAQKLFNSLLAATATGAGTSETLADGYRSHGLQVVLTGGPATCVVALEGSLNGSNWFVLATWTLSPQASGDIVFAVDKPVVAVRANCTTLSGGTVPTVRADIVSVP